jgi:hypothetical protein
MEPRVEVEMAGAGTTGAADRWRTVWKIQNVGAAPLQILSARLPHGKFRSEEKKLAPPLDVPSNETGRIEIDARCGEPAGSEVENAFVILRATQEGAPWLILARLRIRIDADGTPRSTTELITVQPVGFSERQIT